MTTDSLAEDLLHTPRQRWVRVVAHWLAHTGPASLDEAGLTGEPVVDALVAAAAAQLARSRGLPVPGWTLQQNRFLSQFWQPAGPAFYAWSLAHAAEEFLLRGIIVEQNSLVAV